MTWLRRSGERRSGAVAGTAGAGSIELYDDELEAAVRAEVGEEYDDYALVTQYLAGELSPADRERVEERLRIDRKFRALAEPLIVFWKHSGPIYKDEDLIDAVGAARSWQKLKERMELEQRGRHTLTLDEKRARKRWRRRFVSTTIAAALVAWLGPRLVPRSLPVPAFDSYLKLDAPMDRQFSGTLRDHTQLTLAPGTHLGYWYSFGVSDKVLNIDGEGTFTMAPNSRQPLVVAGPGVEVTAFEGRFTIEAFTARPFAYVKVDEGRAEVRARTFFGYGQMVTLHAGEAARVGPGMWIERFDAPIEPHARRTR